MLHHMWDLEPSKTTLRRPRKVTVYGSTVKDTKFLGPVENTYVSKGTVLGGLTNEFYKQKTTNNVLLTRGKWECFFCSIAVDSFSVKAPFVLETFCRSSH